MSNGTVIFDFDSTVIQIESLEEILLEKLKDRPADMETIKQLTDQGMNGDISFQESIQKRLRIAAPDLEDLDHFYHQHSTNILTTGLKALIHWLQDQNIDVYIISGGLYESILPYAKELNINKNHVHAVRLEWNSENKFAGINLNDPFSHSKAHGAQHIAQTWQRPSIIIGDGYTDYQLYENGYVDHFIAYTEHQKRDKVINLAEYIAEDCIELKKHLQELLLNQK